LINRLVVLYCSYLEFIILRAYLLKSVVLVVLLLAIIGISHASHYRAGEITYKQISGLTYKVMVVTYTNPKSVEANKETKSIVINWGDTIETEVSRTQMELLNPDVQRNTYIYDHTYAVAGLYRVSITDYYRVQDIININGGHTDQIAFYVESLINASLPGRNQSPVLTVPPIVDGCIDFLYLHNPGASDPDGDSLVYVIVPPMQSPGEPVPNYLDPAARDSFRLNPHTGQLYWSKPMALGIYNIAIRIWEYRNGKMIGYITRDMQITIKDCRNIPPKIIAQNDQSCVAAGDTVAFDITGLDTNFQKVTLRGYGGPFEVPLSKAFINPNPAQGIDSAFTRFTWQTKCSHIRYRDYQSLIEAKDDYSTPMADYWLFNIKVVGPAPENVVVKQVGNGFKITWTKDRCNMANKYRIYRRIDSSHWNPSSCETGVPAYTGFQLIGIDQADALSFYDDNKGAGLSPLVRYCYRIVAVYPPRNVNGDIIIEKSAESYASTEICNVIIRSKPIITHVSVTTTDITLGALKLAWIRPDTLDTSMYTSPYRMIFKKAIAGTNNFTSFKTLDYPTFASLPDSSLIDTNLNTIANRYAYKIEFYYDSLGTQRYLDVSPSATSVFTSVNSTDNTNILSWTEDVPWINTQYAIYRKNDVTGLFDSIASTPIQTYTDGDLLNGKQYCYYIRSYGSYSSYNSILINHSQQICGTPIDTVRPCPPQLTVNPPCNSFNDFTNQLLWRPDQSCEDDAVSYNIYYKKLQQDEFVRIGSVSNQVLQYADIRELLKFSIAGCYAVTGVDSFNNESPKENTVCIDNCPSYEIPNVFTPNGDGKNDLLNPFPYRFIDRIHLRVYSRWGQLVFKTDDPDINWDGKDQQSKADCTAGVYFYTCDVYEQYLDQLKNNARRGTIQIIR
jgi:gliding motility-associated-like protein